MSRSDDALWEKYIRAADDPDFWPSEIVGVMGTGRERNWTAHIVIASGHAGLKPHFAQLQAAMYHALAVIDDPQDVLLYLRAMMMASASWLDCCTTDGDRK